MCVSHVMVVLIFEECVVYLFYSTIEYIYSCSLG